MEGDVYAPSRIIYSTVGGYITIEYIAMYTLASDLESPHQPYPDLDVLPRSEQFKGGNIIGALPEFLRFSKLIKKSR